MLIPPIIHHTFAFIIAAICAFALSPLCFRVALKLGAVDVPTDDRRMHRHPIPRAGGLAVFGAFILPMALFASADSVFVPLLSGGLVILSAGLLDDVYRITPLQKLSFQILAALVATALTHRTIPTFFSVLWLVFMSNAFNLIDGLDGLCARVAVFSAFALFFLGTSPSSLMLAGALLGFLPFNLRPAKIFLGDTGSLFVGFSLGILSLETAATVGTNSYLPLVLIFALPISDTVFAFFRRLLKGKSPFSPDRGHFHHRLTDIGFSHGEASLLLSLFSLALCSVGVAIG